MLLDIILAFDQLPFMHFSRLLILHMHFDICVYITFSVHFLYSGFHVSGLPMQCSAVWLHSEGSTHKSIEMSNQEMSKLC
jgi:hypothetical protein